ncbi:hypothetical protein KSP39_PZI023039 [Platanthera zijinensis]|uniref:Reverse transcriptase Ty1/copia-type domain-containing protein n=1 Tax=Platanthera zijinensis TaxID=2320716 RepID=A0AAP0FUB1_9ASPA
MSSQGKGAVDLEGATTNSSKQRGESEHEQVGATTKIAKQSKFYGAFTVSDGRDTKPPSSSRDAGHRSFLYLALAEDSSIGGLRDSRNNGLGVSRRSGLEDCRNNELVVSRSSGLEVSSSSGLEVSRSSGLEVSRNSGLMVSRSSGLAINRSSGLGVSRNWSSEASWFCILYNMTHFLELLVVCYLLHLPDSYDLIRQQILEETDTPTPDANAARISAVTTLLQRPLLPSPSPDIVAHPTRHDTFGGRGGRSGVRGYSKHLCSHCGRLGHLGDRCWTKHPHLRPTSADSFKQSTFSLATSGAAQLAIMGSNQLPLVLIADGSPSLVCGSGIVHVALSLQLQDTLYVPNFPCNFLSVTALCKHGIFVLDILLLRFFISFCLIYLAAILLLIVKLVNLASITSLLFLLCMAAVLLVPLTLFIQMFGVLLPFRLLVGFFFPIFSLIEFCLRFSMAKPFFLSYIVMRHRFRYLLVFLDAQHLSTLLFLVTINSLLVLLTASFWAIIRHRKDIGVLILYFEDSMSRRIPFFEDAPFFSSSSILPSSDDSSSLPNVSAPLPEPALVSSPSVSYSFTVLVSSPEPLPPAPGPVVSPLDETDTIDMTDLDLPTALQKGVRSCTQHPLQVVVSYAQLSPSSRSFALALSTNVVPASYHDALVIPHWKAAMDEEKHTLTERGTWTLVPTPGVDVVGCRWVFVIKFLPDGTIDRYKTQLVVKGFTQTYGVDFFDIFSPVAQITIIRETVYMEQPPGYVAQGDSQVCKLRKAIYGLKQSLRAWFDKFNEVISVVGFARNAADHSLFIRKTSAGLVILTVYVDDILLTGDDREGVNMTKKHLLQHFVTKDMRSLKYFLGVEIFRKSGSIVLSQRKYASDLLKETGLLGAKPARSPMSVGDDKC